MKHNLKNYLKKQLYFFVGNNSNYTIEQQLLNGTLLLIAIVYLLTIIIDFNLGYPKEIYISLGIGFSIMVILYLLARKKCNVKLLVFLSILCVIITIPFIWFLNGGLMGSTIFYYLPMISFIILLSEGAYRIIMFFLIIIEFVSIILTELHMPELVSLYKTREIQYLDISVSIIVCFFLTALIVYIAKKLYQQERRNTIDIIEQYRKSSDDLRNTMNAKLVLLSIREREVFKCIIEGKTNKEIANLLNVSPGTIKNHVTRIYKKIEVNKRIDVINSL